jgi:type VI secretion system secreted protein Hcp
VGVPMNGEGNHGDMFLSVKGAKAGVINGESEDAAHPKKIEVVSWGWGMNQRLAPGGGTVATGRRSLHELKITKSIDTASTGLMWALRHNEIIEATLIVRKAGKTPLEFLKIKVADARVSSIDIQGGVPPGSVGVVEVVTFAFNKIDIEYHGQGRDGQGLGGFNFEDAFDSEK